MIFSLVKDFFNWVEVLSRRVITLLGSATEIVFEMGHLRKKVLNTLSNFELEKYSCAVSWKGIFSLDKDLFKWIEVISRSVIILVLSEPEIIFDIGHLRKKVLNTLSNFELKNYSIAVSWKVTLSPVKELFKWVEVLIWSVIILVDFETEIIFDIGHLRKKYLTRCQISSSKKTLVQFLEK